MTFQKYSVSFYLFLIVVAAFALRIYNLDHQSLWLDEIASMNGSEPDLSIPSILHYSKGDQPPAFFLLLHNWLKIFSMTDFNGRLLSVMLGVVGVISVFFLGKEAKNNQTGLLAALLTAINFLHIYFSQEVRFYTLVFIASTVSFLFFLKAAKYHRPLDFIAYSLSTTLLIYTHYYGLVVFATQGILFLVIVFFYKKDIRFIISSVASGVSILAMIAPWIPVFFADAQIKNFWIPAEPFYFPLQYFWVYFRDPISCLVFGCLIIYYLIAALKQSFKQYQINLNDLILFGSVFLGFLIPLIYSLIQTPLLVSRYTTIVLPSIIVIISLAISTLTISFQRILLIVTTGTALISLFWIQGFYTKSTREDWRGIVGIVIQKAGPTDIIVSEKEWYCNYYFKTLQSSKRAISNTLFKSDHEEGAGVWWIDGFDVGASLSKSEQQFIESGYHPVSTDSLFKARATYYLPDKLDKNQ